MIVKRSWEAFREAKLLWWINRILHTFGWALVMVIDKDGNIIDAYPANVSYRGFSAESEAAGFEGIAKLIRYDDLPTEGPEQLELFDETT